MAASQSQRLKRKAEKEARRRLVVAEKRKADMALVSPRTPRDLLSAGLVPPIHCCYVTQGIFGVGIGSVVLARETRSGLLAVSFFLVDVWCLGVKNAFFRLLSRSEFEEYVDAAHEEQPFVDIDLSVARKLLHDAAAYARGFGLPPAEGFAKAELLFFDTPMAPDTFNFGKDGKPWFCSGPHDTPARCRHIINALEKSVGEGGYEYIIGVGHGM